MKYFLKGDWEKGYTKVTKEQYISAEGEAGFFPKGDDNIATAWFTAHGVNGRTKCEDKDKKEYKKNIIKKNLKR